MRILQVDKFLRRQGGASSYMLDLAAAQRRRGHPVEFFAMQHPDNLPATYEELFPAHVEFDGIAAGVRPRINAAATMLWSRRAADGARELVSRFRPDVAHVHNIYHQLSPSILWALAGAGVPVVMTVHDFKLICPTYRMLDANGPCEACLGGGFHHAALRRCRDGSLAASTMMALETAVHRWARSYRHVRRFLVPSRFLVDKLTIAGFPPDRIRHVPNFVDSDVSASARASRTAEGRRSSSKIIYVGRLSPEKGVDVAIDAIGEVAGCTLDIIGSGPEESTLRARAWARAPGRIRFRGQLSKQEVMGAMSEALAVVLPARYYENQPMSVLEAFTCATPVLGTELGGMPELVCTAKPGWCRKPAMSARW